MKRRIIGLSSSTKVISLPSSWVKKNNLSKGMSLEVDEKDNRIIISKSPEKQVKSTEINASCLTEDLLWLTVDSAYISGYDEIIVQTKDYKQTQLITEIARYFPGMVIYEEKEKYAKLKSISSKEELDISKITGRIRNLTISILDDSIEAAKKKEWGILLEAKKRDYTLNTYASLAFRHLNIYGYSPASKHSVIALHIKTLEFFTDILCELLKKIGAEKKASTHEILALQHIREMYREESPLTTKFTFQKLSEYEEKRQKLLKLSKKCPERTRGNMTSIARAFFDIEEIAGQLNA